MIKCLLKELTRLTGTVYTWERGRGDEGCERRGEVAGRGGRTGEMEGRKEGKEEK